MFQNAIKPRLNCLIFYRDGHININFFAINCMLNIINGFRSYTK